MQGASLAKAAQIFQENPCPGALSSVKPTWGEKNENCHVLSTCIIYQLFLSLCSTTVLARIDDIIPHLTDNKPRLEEAKPLFQVLHILQPELFSSHTSQQQVSAKCWVTDTWLWTQIGIWRLTLTD